MQVVQNEITLKLSEREARLLGFALHEYIWSQAKKFKEQHPEGTWEGFLRINEPSDSSNDMFEMWASLTKFWKQESISDFEKLIRENLKLPVEKG